jgi:hypothetical protein
MTAVFVFKLFCDFPVGIRHMFNLTERERFGDNDADIIDFGGTDGSNDALSRCSWHLGKS